MLLPIHTEKLQIQHFTRQRLDNAHVHTKNAQIGVQYNCFFPSTLGKMCKILEFMRKSDSNVFSLGWEMRIFRRCLGLSTASQRRVFV